VLLEFGGYQILKWVNRSQTILAGVVLIHHSRSLFPKYGRSHLA